MQFCHRYVRITGLLSAPIAFKNWGLAVRLACNHPCSLTSPRKLTKRPKLQIKIYFELKLRIRNYFGLFLRTTTHFELKFELQ